jgi:protease-4
MSEESQNKDIEKQAVVQLADISKQLLEQNRSQSRWRRLSILFIFGYIGFMLYLGVSSVASIEDITKKETPFIAEISLSGVISQAGDIDSDEVYDLLKEAFEHQNSKAVILRLNSPGGSPVQSNRINNAINILRKQYKKKLYVVMEDICASGCYFIAAAADEIYADESSIIGSIGVIMSGFGVTDAMEKLGIKRRLYTAGKYKGLLDPFSPEDSFAVRHIQTEILAKSHQNFINVVKKGRGDKLKENENLFSGLVWLGKESIELGLIDGIGNSLTIANKLKIKNIVRFEKPKTLLEEFIQSSSEIFIDTLWQQKIKTLSFK